MYRISYIKQPTALELRRQCSCHTVLLTRTVFQDHGDMVRLYRKMRRTLDLRLLECCGLISLIFRRPELSLSSPLGLLEKAVNEFRLKAKNMDSGDYEAIFSLFMFELGVPLLQFHRHVPNCGFRFVCGGAFSSRGWDTTVLVSAHAFIVPIGSTSALFSEVLILAAIYLDDMCNNHSTFINPPRMDESSVPTILENSGDECHINPDVACFFDESTNAERLSLTLSRNCDCHPILSNTMTVCLGDDVALTTAYWTLRECLDGRLNQCYKFRSGHDPTGY